MNKRELIGYNIAQFRKKLGYTQAQISTLLGISQPAYLKYENGDTEISVQKLEQLAEIFGTTSASLIECDQHLTQARVAFAYRKNGEINNEQELKQFFKIISNYIIMSNELKKEK